MPAATTDSVPTRQAVTLNLSPGAARLVSGVRRETGITQVAFLERLLEWYAVLDPHIKTMILTPYPEVRRGSITLLLEQMKADAGELDAPPKFSALIDHAYESPGQAEEKRTASPRRRTRHGAN